MSSRIAMMACKGPLEGSWMQSSGTESGITVSGLGEGEELVVECDDNACVISMNGETPFPKTDCKRYRISKRGSGQPTTVRVLLCRTRT